MKYEIVETSPNNTHSIFPCLMKVKQETINNNKHIDFNFCVLMSAFGKGVVITGKSKKHPIGEYWDDWNMQVFEVLPSTTKVILSN